MRVEDIINDKGSDVLTIGPEASVADVAAILAGRRIGAIVVVSGGEIRGIVSERDVVRTLSTRGVGTLETLVRDCMTERVVTCTPEDTIDEVMEIMTNGRFRHLPVLKDGELGGIISIGDVVKRRIQEVQNEADAIRAYIATA